MTPALPNDFDERATAGLRCLAGMPELRSAVWREVLSFFQRHPEIERTELGAAFIACALLDAWAPAAGAIPPADSQSATQPTAEAKKVA